MGHCSDVSYVCFRISRRARCPVAVTTWMKWELISQHIQILKRITKCTTPFHSRSVNAHKHIVLFMLRCYRFDCALFCSFLNLLRSAGAQCTGEALLLFILFIFIMWYAFWFEIILFCCVFLPVLCYAMPQQWVIQPVQWWWGVRSEKINAKSTKHFHSLACKMQTTNSVGWTPTLLDVSTTIRDPNVIYTEYFAIHCHAINMWSEIPIIRFKFGIRIGVSLGLSAASDSNSSTTGRSQPQFFLYDLNFTLRLY